MINSNQKVKDFLLDIQSTFPEKFKIIEALQTIFFEGNEDLEDDIKYGGLVFNLDKKLLGGIYLYKEHLSIEFSNGANFSDPSGLLEGKGKLRRHLKIREIDEIESKEARFYIEQAVNP